MNYEQKYNEALERARKWYNTNTNEGYRGIFEDIFPELEESEDEKIRKVLVEFFKNYKEQGTIGAETFNGIPTDNIIAWLEKQESVEEIVERCKTSWYNEGKLQGKMEGLSDEEKYHCIPNTNKNYYQIMADWLKSFKDRIQSKQSNKPQGKSALEAINEETVDNSNKIVNAKFKVGDIVQYITDSTDRRKIEEVDTLCNMYHTDSSPIMFEIEDEWKVVVNAEDVEQNPTNKVEPKFKVGKWYQCTKDFFGKGVTFDKNTAYYCAKEGCLQDEYGCHIAIVKDLYDNFKLWSIADAKDGDILYTMQYNTLWSYKDKTHCNYSINLNNGIHSQVSIYGWVQIPNDARPACKEQRDLLFEKLEEAGYMWDNENKELIKIE